MAQNGKKRPIFPAWSEFVSHHQGHGGLPRFGGFRAALALLAAVIGRPSYQVTPTTEGIERGFATGGFRPPPSSSLLNERAGSRRPPAHPGNQNFTRRIALRKNENFGVCLGQFSKKNVKAQFWAFLNANFFLIRKGGPDPPPCSLNTLPPPLGGTGSGHLSAPQWRSGLLWAHGCRGFGLRTASVICIQVCPATAIPKAHWDGGFAGRKGGSLVWRSPVVS